MVKGKAQRREEAAVWSLVAFSRTTTEQFPYQSRSDHHPAPLLLSLPPGPFVLLPERKARLASGASLIQDPPAHSTFRIQFSSAKYILSQQRPAPTESSGRFGQIRSDKINYFSDLSNFFELATIKSRKYTLSKS